MGAAIHPMACAEMTAARSPPGFAGSFMQLWHRHHHWSDYDWDALFEAFASLGLRYLVVQWTRVDGFRFDRHLAGRSPSGDGTPLQAILRRAQDWDLRVMVGLDHEASWWSCARLTVPELEAYLARRLLSTLALARGLAPHLRARPSFEGWYISEEIDAKTFASAGSRRAVRMFLHQLGAGLRRLMPDATIGVSEFAAAGSQPGACAQLWGELLDGGASVDRLLVQDGIGVGAHTLDHWAERVSHLSQLARTVSVPKGAALELWPVVETFTQTAGPGIDALGFSARPAPFDRLQEQLRVAARAGPAIAFSVPDYLVPQAGPEALALYQAYRAAGLGLGVRRAIGLRSAAPGRQGD